MSDGWLNSRGVRMLCATIAATQLAIAVINLAYIPSEIREHRAWQSRQGSPGVATSAPPPEAQPRPRREPLRFVKQQLDLDRECNFTTWLASMQSALVAFAAFLLAFATGRRAWLLVMLGFLYLSIDEICQVHEWVGFQMAESGWRIGALDPPYPWIVVLGPLLLIYALVLARFLARQLAPEPDLRRRALLGLLFMGSTLPLEAIGGWIQGHAPRPPRLEVIAEESLETWGVTLFLYVFLTMLGSRSSAEASPAGQEVPGPGQTPPLGR